MNVKIINKYNSPVIIIYYNFNNSKNGHGLWFEGEKWNYTGLNSDKKEFKNPPNKFLQSAIKTIFTQDNINNLLNRMKNYENRNKH